MPATITFTDTIGAASLSNSKTSPADRFSNWTPDSMPVGTGAAAQSNGVTTFMRFRDDYGATFDLEHIPSTGASSMLSIADRLRRHLLMGGTCAVNTGDVASSAYATCALKPGTTPTLKLSDRQLLEYTLTLHLINVAASPVQMVCRYAEQ
jgi:hypothetical protein